MAQKVRVPTTKPYVLSLIARIHLTEGENLFCAVL